MRTTPLIQDKDFFSIQLKTISYHRIIIKSVVFLIFKKKKAKSLEEVGETLSWATGIQPESPNPLPVLEV